MSRLCKVLACLVAVSALSVSLRAADGWVEDLEAAKAAAKKEHKDLLMDFTGSDWCGWCMRLHKEVFDKDEFKTYAGKDLVLLELDFPRRKQQDEKIAAQNKVLAEKFSIEGYPTIMLADADGVPYARTGYQEGGAAKYVEHLQSLRAQKDVRDKLLKEASTAQGAEKAKLLDQFVGKMEEYGVGGAYQQYIAQIRELDKDDGAGLKGKYENREKLQAIIQVAEGGDFNTALAQAEAFAKTSKLDSRLKQEAHFLRASLLYQKQENAAAIQALNEAKAAAPDSDRAKQIDQILQSLKQKDEAAAGEKAAGGTENGK